MNLKFHLTLSLLLMLSAQFASARCNGDYADHLIAERYNNCAGLADSAKNKFEGLYRAVSDVCMGGCYSAMFNPDLKPECDRKYATALEGFDIPSLAKSMGCSDNGAYVKNSGAAGPVDPDSVCSWISRQEVMLNCGGTSGSRVCGKDNQVVCSGFVECSRPFVLNGQTLGADVYNTNCLASESDCSRISLKTCFSDPMVTATDFSSIKPASSKSKQGTQ